MIFVSLPTVRFGQALAALALLVVAFAASPAMAQNNGSFSLKLSEKEMNLVHPGDMEWQKYLMWDLAFQRMNDRNMPYLELTNDSMSTAPISEFRFTIGDSRFNFSDSFMGEFAMLGDSTPGFNITSSTAGGLGNELIVKIEDGGLLPGELIRFKIDLDVDEAFADQFFQHPDYRTVLFDMNGLNVYDGFLTQFNTADNAMATALFNPASGPDFAAGPVALPDELVIGPEANFFNENYRRYNEMDPVRTFLAGEGGSEIPEPGSAALALLGLCGSLAFSLRSRRFTLAS